MLFSTFTTNIKNVYFLILFYFDGAKFGPTREKDKMPATII